MEEIRRSPVDVGSVSHYFQGVLYMERWLFGNSSNQQYGINQNMKKQWRCMKVIEQYYLILLGIWDFKGEFLMSDSVLEFGEHPSNKSLCKCWDSFR